MANHPLTRCVIGLLLPALLLLSLAGPSQGYTPDDPVVTTMVEKAVRFLGRGNYRSEPGGMAVISLALIKSGQDPSHPYVQGSIRACQAFAAKVAQSGVGHAVYNAAICCIFLCEVDPEGSRDAIETLKNAMLARQRPNGCWGYEEHAYDDTSQSQYGMLCLWAAHNAGFEVPVGAVENGAAWFLRVQSRTGGWAYKARDPGSMQLVEQSMPTTGMTAAGAGSLYVAAHMLGFGAKQGQADESKLTNVPAALRSVKEKEVVKRFLTPTRLSRAPIDNAQLGARTWLEKNFNYETTIFQYYGFYSVERYKSFEEIVEGTSEREPAWYNQGVDFLKAEQQGNGSWSGQSGVEVATGFAVLFLTRGTKKSIAKSEEGSTRGAKGLPDDLTDIRLVDGKVVDVTEQAATIDQLLEELEAGAGTEIDAQLPAELQLSDDPVQRAAQVARLRRMLMNGSYQARLAAANTLGRDRDLGNVPVLIFALSDPDHRIIQAARDGLRFISRKFDGFGLSDKPGTQQWRDAQQKWTQWYLSVRPDGTIIE